MVISAGVKSSRFFEPDAGSVTTVLPPASVEASFISPAATCGIVIPENCWDVAYWAVLVDAIIKMDVTGIAIIKVPFD